MNIPQLWQQRATEQPDKVFLYFGGQEITYATMFERINQAARGLAARGVGAGDFVAIMQTNAPEFLYAWFGLNMLGAVAVPINPVFTEAEMGYILGHSGAKAMILEPKFLPLLEQVEASAKEALGAIFVTGAEGEAAGHQWFGALLTGDGSPLDIAVDEQAPCVCIYTSGTTSMPKGVLNSHYGWVTTGQSYAYTVGIQAADRVMTPNPLFHANAQVYSTMGVLNAGASLILLERFSGSRIIEQAVEYQATIMVLVQAVTPWVWAREPMAIDREHTVRTMVAGSVPPDIYPAFEERFGLKIQTIYSLTESTMAIMGPREGTMPRKPGTIGVPMEHPDPSVDNAVRIVDAMGREAAPGGQGEIIIKNPAVMLEYYRDPEKTAETKRDGWIHTGDVGWRDDEGYIHFVGRQKEVIRRRGELISPTQIEAVLNAHELIEESAVIGVPSDLGTGEEEVKAFIKLVDGASLSEEEARAWCSGKLAEFKIPAFIVFVEGFEKSAIGRIKKELLKKQG
ncbi:MAG: AMP-binding protein [Desulfarculaceae bacterium]|nr:AMP-binding protein [Desulfarculaceae bacterium]